jgi:hypothetical protein
MQCPACSSQLVPKVLGCTSCGLEVSGQLELNEFAMLAGEDLRLLRIFVMAEGRIRDMEAPLGLSYPTIRTRLAALREKLAPGTPPPRAKPSAKESAIAVTLDKLQTGDVSFDEALAAIRRIKTKKETP